MNLNNIYSDSEEKYVKTVILYGHTDNYVYADAEHTQKIDKDTLLNLCLKGVTINYQSAYYMPIFFKENSGHLEITIATAIASSASTAVVLNSEEYSAD